MVRLLLIITLLPLLSTSQNKESQYLFSIVGGGELLADRNYYNNREKELSIHRQPGISYFAMFGLCKGHDNFPAIAFRYLKRAGSYVSSAGSNAGGISYSANYHLERGDITALYYFAISKRGFVTMGTGLYYGYLLSASGTAYTHYWSIAYEDQWKESSVRKAISNNVFGTMLDFRFNIPVHQKHFMTFSLTFALESPQANTFGKTVGVGLGYTLRKLKEQKTGDTN